MAFFQRNFYTPETSFTPLFRLLEDFDSYSRQGQGQGQGHSHHHGTRRSALPQWQPKFDVRETEAAYELHGELPGMNKSDVHIEFTDPQTMLIRGRVERTYHAGTPPADQLEGSTMSGAITEAGEGEQAKSPSHKATVEDENEDSTEVTSGEVATTSASTSTEKAPVDTAKYWLTERSIGEFSRTFNFPTRVSQDDVTASFKDGILNITVAKAAKHEPRRISIL